MADLSDLAVQIAGDIKGRAPLQHTHTQAQVTGLDDALAGKVSSTPTDLGTAHLDTITTPGTYTQPFASRSTKSQGYPYETNPTNGIAGILDVQLWNPSNGSLIATYKPWAGGGGPAYRTYYQGVWRPWQDALGNPVGTTYTIAS